MQNTIGKLPEKIVAQMLAAELEEKNLLPPTLGSYRKGKDTWVNAAVLASDVYDGFERGEETVVVALDLEDAYNRVQYKILRIPPVQRVYSRNHFEPVGRPWQDIKLC